MEFDLNQAIAALTAVCRQHRGTADDHEYLRFVVSEIATRLGSKPNLKTVPRPDPEG